MKPLILYHAECLDGLTAAWAVRKLLPEAECVPVKHGSTPPDVTGRHVVMVDFCYPKPAMLEMLDKATRIDIYDHHKTAQETLLDLQHPNLGTVVFDMDRSGAGLAWDYFPGTLNTTRPMLVNLVEDNDLWRFKHPETKRFVEAMRAMPTSFETIETLVHVCGDPLLLSSFLAIGDGVVRYKQEMVTQAVHFSQKALIGGHLVNVANVPYFLSSEAANALIRDGPFGATYYWDGDSGMYRVSLRSRDDREDVSVIAKMYGGGGHRNASGFTCKKLPWTDDRKEI